MKASIRTIQLNSDQWLVITEIENAQDSISESLFIKLLVQKGDFRTIPNQRDRVMLQQPFLEKILICWRVVVPHNQKTTVSVSIKLDGKTEKIFSTVLSPTTLSSDAKPLENVM